MDRSCRRLPDDGCISEAAIRRAPLSASPYLLVRIICVKYGPNRDPDLVKKGEV